MGKRIQSRTRQNAGPLRNGPAFCCARESANIADQIPHTQKTARPQITTRSGAPGDRPPPRLQCEKRLPPEGPNPQKVLRTFPGTPPGRCRGLPRRKEFRLPVFSFAVRPPSLTPSVAFGDSSLGEGAFRDGGPLAVEGIHVASLSREVAKRSFDGRSFVSLSCLLRSPVLP